jgi:hypothetical protein
MTPSRIAVVFSARSNGAVLRQAKLLARDLSQESRLAGEEASVVMAYPAGPQDEWAPELGGGVESRTIEWQTVDSETARRAMLFNGDAEWTPAASRYLIAEDGMQQLCDCDCWLVVGDGLTAPLLPLRPYAMVLYDAPRQPLPKGARAIVPAAFIERKLAGARVSRLPLALEHAPADGDAPPYFFCPCALDADAIAVLAEYYALGGRLDCVAAGTGAFSPRVRCLGELSNSEHTRRLASAEFVWLPRRVEGAAIVAMEAGLCGVPTLAPRSAAMEAAAAEFGLGCCWSDLMQPEHRAGDLKRMEGHARRRLAGRNPGDCWRVVRECL